MREGSLATQHAVNAQSRASIRNAALALLAVGVVLLAIAAVWASVSLSSTRAMSETQGTVVRFLNDSGDLRSFRPVFSFTAENGERVEVAGRTASMPPAYAIGEKVALYYRPANPARGVVIDTFSERWFPVTILGVLGAAFAGAGAIARAFTRDKRGDHASALNAPRGVANKRGALHRRDLLICAIPIAMGAIALAIAAALFLHERQVRSAFAHAQGQVLGSQERSRMFSSTHLYSAVIRFTAANGRTVTFVQGSSSSGNTLDSGDTVDVIYDPANPQRAQLDSFWESWGAAVILLAIGAPLFALGVWFLSGVLGLGTPKKKR
ncbi:DUF3592 domain-containing protein [Paraburkholderia sp. J41]|uniref:DUF3592 domain-containing protein n=1 Tax=Paraburkholderia sp. J41 TaxID=2805433 RepID=UPI002AC35CCF|nr:DUF3592 domain-containing protein [Paraburkholderia sp. J41]